jgi:hypothetical protein
LSISYELEKYKKFELVRCLLSEKQKELLNKLKIYQIKISDWDNIIKEIPIYILLDGYLVACDMFDLGEGENKRIYFVERLIFNQGDIIGEIEAEIEIDGEHFEKGTSKINVKPGSKEISYLLAYTNEERESFLRNIQDETIKILSIPNDVFQELMKKGKFANSVYKNFYLKERRFANLSNKEPDSIIQTLKLALNNLKRINKNINKLIAFPSSSTPASDRLNALIRSSDYFTRINNRKTLEETKKINIIELNDIPLTDLYVYNKELEDKVSNIKNEFKMFSINDVSDLRKCNRILERRSSRNYQTNNLIEKINELWSYSPLSFLKDGKRKMLIIEFNE